MAWMAGAAAATAMVRQTVALARRVGWAVGEAEAWVARSVARTVALLAAGMAAHMVERRVPVMAIVGARREARIRPTRHLHNKSYWPGGLRTPGSRIAQLFHPQNHR